MDPAGEGTPGSYGNWTTNEGLNLGQMGAWRHCRCQPALHGEAWTASSILLVGRGGMVFVRIARLPAFRVPSLSVCCWDGAGWRALRGPDCRHLHIRAPPDCALSTGLLKQAANGRYWLGAVEDHDRRDPCPIEC